MTDRIWEELRNELILGASQKGHPFRYCTFATVGFEHLPRLRTVVVRHVSDRLNLTFYTDRRSKKVIHIKENNKVSMLFYHPEKLLQLKIEGLASLVRDDKRLNAYLKNIEADHLKDYTTHIAPGSAIGSPDEIEYLDKNNYFCAIEMEPFKIEYLKLQRPSHLRVRFSKEDDRWNSEFLVP
ncbi:pyridoxamine 5'-phosphate oxidase family protein [Pseudozobellia thermophila]|uniref:Pyridoxine/pyridoxamine 5'-phosphate oxidase n=1 Tax=Pseudozobellia thermophila TaxID=192903 RepID=A0A1M6MMC5_9FLAO|nr:pyridoxamine 5'-phosphate oxidase family protein [Pseudozobellia thermophila]SHJ84612.1 Pyridoxine/pyridoxamine 5'-phosphate oxidase [Pseudozobellia thermophila]